MPLTPVERERIQDSKRKIRSVSKTLQHVDPGKVSDLEAIQNCLDDADRTLDTALKTDRDK